MLDVKVIFFIKLFLKLLIKVLDSKGVILN